MERKRKWTDADLRSALYAIRDEKTTIELAAQMYKIPRSTLRDYIKNKRKKNPCLQRIRTSLTDENDNYLEEDKEEITKMVPSYDTDTSSFYTPIWYCHACKEDKIGNMRKCNKCFKWYHELCVGLTLEDSDPFDCGCKVKSSRTERYLARSRVTEGNAGPE